MWPLSLAEEHVTNYWDTSPGLLFPEAPCLWPAWGFKLPIIQHQFKISTL